MNYLQEELVEHIGDRKVEFVSIVFREGYDTEPIRIKGTLAEVLPQLDFDYNTNYNGQQLFGFIWYEDGTWSARGEYDGSEWWQHQTPPDRDAEIEFEY